MKIELCKFAGGTCNLCEGGDVCKRVPTVDMSTAQRFIEDTRRVLPCPTCEAYEGRWQKAFEFAVKLVQRDPNSWDGISRKGDVVLRVYPQTTLDTSRWFNGGCRRVTTTLLEKNPPGTDCPLPIGAQNGLAVCHGIPFAFDTRGRANIVTRPVAQVYRQRLLSQYIEFEERLGRIYRSR